MVLLRRAMEIPGLGLDLGLLLVDYYIARNKTARQSHTKTWLATSRGGEDPSAVDRIETPGYPHHGAGKAPRGVGEVYADPAG